MYLRAAAIQSASEDSDRSRQFPHFPQVWLDHVDAVLDCGGKRRTRRVQEKFRTQFPRCGCGPGIEIIWYAGRQAAASYDIAWLPGSKSLKAFAPFGFMQGFTGQHKPVLRTRAALGDRKVLPGVGFRFNQAAWNVFFLEKPSKEFARKASHGKNGFGIAAESLDHPRHIDSAPAGVAPRLSTAQLQTGNDSLNRGRQINRWIGRERDDLRHRWSDLSPFTHV